MKLLILRFSSIGDIVLTSPVVRCLREQTGAEIHFLTKKSFAPIVAENPFISRVFSFEKNISEVITDLKSMGYDAVIDLHNNLRSRQLTNALGCKTHRFSKLNFQKWLLVNFKIDRLPEAHVVDRYLAAAQKFGVKNDGRGLDFFIPKKDEVAPGFLEKGLLPGNYIAFAIGAAHATKLLPENKMTEICTALIAQKNRKIVLLGGPAEREIGERIAQKTGATNACGKLNLAQSACLVRDAGAVLSPDTGLMHIAAAFQKKIVSVWGSTVPAFGMSPYFGYAQLETRNPLIPRQSGKLETGKNFSLEVANLGCRPCSKIGFDACPKGHFRCMNDQSVEKIVEILDKLMG